MSWMGQARKLRMVWYTILYVLARADMFLVFARRETLCFDPPLQTKEAQRIARTHIYHNIPTSYNAAAEQKEEKKNVEIRK